MTDPIVVLNRLASIASEYADLTCVGNEFFLSDGELFKSSLRMYTEHIRNHCNELIEELNK